MNKVNKHNSNLSNFIKDFGAAIGGDAVGIAIGMVVIGNIVMNGVAGKVWNISNGQAKKTLEKVITIMLNLM